MTNFDHLKEIINDNESVEYFLCFFWDNFCESMCPLWREKRK